MELQKEIEYRGSELVTLDVLKYDVSAEASEPVEFHFWQWFEEAQVIIWAPLSYLYVYARYGWVGMQIRSLAPPSKPENKDEVDARFDDAEKPQWAPGGSQIFGFGTFMLVQKCILFVALGMHFSTKDAQQSSKTPGYCFCIFALLFVTISIAVANKKGFRKNATQSRMISHRERRAEELLFGWLPLPWRLAVFELRLAAHQVGVDLQTARFTFHGITVEDLKSALGENCLRYLEPCGPQVFEDEHGRAQCTAMAMMLRLALDSLLIAAPTNSE